jgi:hypothetical protein
MNLRSWIVENPIHQVLQTHFPIPFHVFPTTFSLWGTNSPKKERDQVTDLLIQYENVIAFSMKDLSRCKTMQFSIDLIDDTPIYRRRHRLSKHEWELEDERCKELHEAGLIQPSSSDFAATTVMLAKKDSAGLWTEKRMCGDYRPLNLVTPQNRYPMPIPEELFDSIGDSNISQLWT